MEFEKLWIELTEKLRPRLIIPNWTIDKGYFGGTLTITDVSEDTVDVEVATAKNIQVVRKTDFEEVWRIWDDYKSGKIRRRGITPLTRNSRYVISILHWVESL